MKYETIMTIVCGSALAMLAVDWLLCAAVYHCRSGFWCGGAINPCNDAGLPTWVESDAGPDTANFGERK